MSTTADLLSILSGDTPARISTSELSRLKRRYRTLLTSERPAVLLRSWLRRYEGVSSGAVAAVDLRDLSEDPRLLPSGISDPRSGLATAGEFAGWVHSADLPALRSEFGRS